MLSVQSVVNTYSVKDELEIVTLVDAKDTPLGPYNKIAAHQIGKLHRAFSIFIINRQGEILLQKRASCKYHFADLWSNTCCGHPRPDEETRAAALRRLGEEFGFSTNLIEITELQYRTDDPASGLIENEYLHVFCGNHDKEPYPNPEEISEYQWVAPRNLLKRVNHTPRIFTPWFILLAKKLISNDGIIHEKCGQKGI